MSEKYKNLFTNIEKELEMYGKKKFTFVFSIPIPKKFDTCLSEFYMLISH